MENLGDIEDDVLAVNPRAYARLHEGGHAEGVVPRLLESLAELLEQHLRVGGRPLHGAFVKLNHGDSNLRGQATNRIPPHGTPWVGRQVVVVGGASLVGVALRAWLREKGVAAVGKGASKGLGGKDVGGVFDCAHVFVGISGFAVLLGWRRCLPCSRRCARRRRRVVRGQAPC